MVGVSPHWQPIPLRYIGCQCGEPLLRNELLQTKFYTTSWKPFAEWKTQQGKATEVVSLASIEKNYEGKDVQEKIRLCVRDYIDKREIKMTITAHYNPAPETLFYVM